jgi:integrase
MADNIARQLSDAAVKNAKAKSRPYKLTDGGGLFLLVQPNGAKLWRYKFRLHGKEGLMAIGAYPDLSLAAARTEHRAARAKVATGQNPVHTRQEDRRQAAQEALRQQIGLFANVVEGWNDSTKPALAHLTIKQRDREIAKYLLPAFGTRLIQSITRTDIAQLLKRVEVRAPEVARNLRNYLSGIYEHAIGVGLLEASPVPPAKILKKRNQVSHKAMTPSQVPGFLRAVEHCTAEPETKAAMMLVILTACRKSELIGARWSEFDLDAGEWLVPADRMKNRREHWVPLPHQAVTILRQLHATATTALIFPNRRNASVPMADRSLNMMMRRIGFVGETVHGFRSLFSTHFNQLGANPDVVERCLAHSQKDKVRAAYNRHQYRQERQQLMQQWADYIDSLRNPVLTVAA